MKIKKIRSKKYGKRILVNEFYSLKLSQDFKKELDQEYKNYKNGVGKNFSYKEVFDKYKNL
jgi:hypothetical protein